MILEIDSGQGFLDRILHVCGDDPIPDYAKDPEIEVFSTYVEMILNIRCVVNSAGSILHVCGDDPITVFIKLCCCLYSPRMWR